MIWDKAILDSRGKVETSYT